MIRTIVFSNVILAAMALPVLAQEEPVVDCANATTQSDLNICAYRDYQAADGALNPAYRKALTAAQETDRQIGEYDEKAVGAVDALKKAQRAWIPYRDGQCALAGFAARGGSMEPMLVSGCLAELTAKRTEELKATVENLGN